MTCTTQPASRGIRSRLRRAFTLVELLVAMSILSVLLLLLSQLLSQVQNTWNYSEGRISQFREARVAFDLITKSLSQASLNTYWDYDRDPSTNQVVNYKQQSELHFLTMRGRDLGSTVDGEISGHAIFFQAPLGFTNTYRNLTNLFNARGYYLVFGSDERFKPSIFEETPSFRYRLMEYRPPAELNQIYIDGDTERQSDREPDYSEWFKFDLAEYSNPLAENIVAFIVAPRDTLETSTEARRDTYSRIARDYTYDSNTHPNPVFAQQLPPLVRVTMVAIDDPSAIRLEAQYGNSPPELVKESAFLDTGSFDSDVEDLKNDLSELNVNHKVFSTMVAIRSSKWRTYAP